MTVRAIAAGLLLLACLSGCTQAKKVSSPSKLEKTCAYAGSFVPCFIRDEALAQTWDI